MVGFWLTLVDGVLGIPLGLLCQNAGEWLLHKHLLHGRGCARNSFWSFHFRDHHRDSRDNDMRDEHYARGPFVWSSPAKELLALAGVSLVVPLFWVSPCFATTVIARTINYYRVHKRSHLDVAWARKRLAWHYDHHMGKDQSANWCVTHPFFDYLMGTRKTYTYVEGKPVSQHCIVVPRRLSARVRALWRIAISPV